MSRFAAALKDMLDLLVLPSGAIGRSAFASGAAALCLAAVLLDRVVAWLADPGGIVPFLFMILVAWSAGCLSRKRLHDLGWSGLAIAAFLAAYIVIVVGSPFVLAVPPPGSWEHALLMAVLFAGPMIGWFGWLVAAPGEAARGQTRAAGDPSRAAGVTAPV